MAPPQNDYFRTPSPVWLIVVPIGVLLVTVAYLAPDALPWDYLVGPFGRTTRWLVEEQPGLLKAVFYSLWVLHAGEAAYAYHLATSKKLSSAGLWAVQTLIYGVFSLSILRAYKVKTH